MSNFEKNLSDFTEDELRQKTNQWGPDFAGLASDELTRRSLDRLQKTFVDFDKSTSRYSKVIIVLTVSLLVLGCMQFVATITPPLTGWKEILAVMILVFGSILYFVKKTIKSIEKW